MADRDPKEGSNYDLSNAIRIRTGVHCFEAKCFAVVASSFMDEAMKDQLAGSDEDARRILENTPRGVSMVVGPDGEQIGQSLSAEEGCYMARSTSASACSQSRSTTWSATIIGLTSSS